jgi:hypothetical protein
MVDASLTVRGSYWICSLDMDEEIDGDDGGQQHHPGLQQLMLFVHVRVAILRN